MSEVVPHKRFSARVFKKLLGLRKYNRIFVFLAQRHYKKFRKRFWLLLHKPKVLGARPLLEKKAIYVKMSDAVNNFALQIHTENNQQLSL